MATLTHHGVRGRQGGRSDTGTQHSHFRACAGRQCKAWGAACSSVEQSYSLAFHPVQGRKKLVQGNVGDCLSHSLLGLMQEYRARWSELCWFVQLPDQEIWGWLSALTLQHREWSATFFSNTILGKRGRQDLQTAVSQQLLPRAFHLMLNECTGSALPISPSLTLVLLSGTKEYWFFPLEPTQISWDTVKAHGTTVPLILNLGA